MNALVTNIKNTLKHTYNGTPWYGPSIKDVTNTLTFEQAVNRPLPQAHTILELLMHMLAWRQYVLAKLQGDEGFDIELNTTADWPQQTGTEDQYIATLQGLETIQGLLLAELESKTDDLLTQLVPGKGFKYGVMLNGLLQHDVYHLGQIGILRKC